MGFGKCISEAKLLNQRKKLEKMRDDGGVIEVLLWSI